MTQEEIEQAAIDWRGCSESAYTTDAFKAGAKWAIEQMRKRARQEVVDKAVSLAAEIFSRPEMKNFDKALEDFKAMLNENKE